MPAGDRKMPEPMVEPITTAIAVQRPIRRGRVVPDVLLMASYLAVGIRARRESIRNRTG